MNIEEKENTKQKNINNSFLRKGKILLNLISTKTTLIKCQKMKLTSHFSSFPERQNITMNENIIRMMKKKEEIEN